MTHTGSTDSVLRTRHLQSTADADVQTAVDLLRSGKTVAIPTETVYGLAANALDELAVASIFRAKGRPGWDPLIVHVTDLTMLARVVRDVPSRVLPLLEKFWPGPLTLLLPRHPSLPLAVTAGRDLVGVRLPSHPVALRVIRESGVPLAAPSANRFGHISPTTVEHVLSDLRGRIDAVLDAGPAEIGVESTVLDPVARVLYRQGGVNRAHLEDALGGRIHVYQAREDGSRQAAPPQSLPSPGVDIRHYAPRARLLLVQGQDELKRLLHDLPTAETAVMLPDDWNAGDWSGAVYRWSRSDDAPGMARTLYAGLRTLDAEGIRFIVCPLPPAGEQPLVEAIRDRLMKAARDA